jgi:hypothetical protein
MARPETTGRKPSVSADLIERDSGPPSGGDEPTQHDQPATQAFANLPPIRGPPPRLALRKVTIVRPEPPALDDADAYSVEEFCRRHRISVQLFYKFKDQMPVTFRIGTRVLISREAAACWRAQRERASKTDAQLP